MKTHVIQLNIILLATVTVLLAGCETFGHKKDKEEISGVELYQEVQPDGTGFSKPVEVGRTAPITVNIESSPFADQRDVDTVSLVEDAGGFSVMLQLNRHGSMMLENVTRSNPNRRIVVFGTFGPSRWLGAPRLSRPIGNGTFVFTPDASREEAERFVRGLSNAVVRIKKDSN